MRYFDCWIQIIISILYIYGSSITGLLITSLLVFLITSVLVVLIVSFLKVLLVVTLTICVSCQFTPFVFIVASMFDYNKIRKVSKVKLFTLNLSFIAKFLLLVSCFTFSQSPYIFQVVLIPLCPLKASSSLFGLPPWHL